MLVVLVVLGLTVAVLVTATVAVNVSVRELSVRVAEMGPTNHPLVVIVEPLIVVVQVLQVLQGKLERRGSGVVEVEVENVAVVGVVGVEVEAEVVVISGPLFVSGRHVVLSHVMSVAAVSSDHADPVGVENPVQSLGIYVGVSVTKTDPVVIPSPLPPLPGESKIGQLSPYC